MVMGAENKIIKTLEEMNLNLERIAKALERAYPSVIITAYNEITEETRSALRRIESTRGDYYRPTHKWE